MGFAGGVDTRCGRIWNPLQTFYQLLREALRFLGIIGAEFHEQEAATFRNQVDVGCAALLECVNDASFHAFETDRMKFENFHHVVSGLERVLVAKRDEAAMLWAVNQLQLGLEQLPRRCLRCRQERAPDGNRARAGVRRGYTPRHGEE